MPDLLVGGERPRNIILGMHPETGIPGIVKDVYYGSNWIWSHKVDDRVQVYKGAGVYYYDLPDYPVEVDVVVVGGGGSGDVGNGANGASGKGGLVGGSKAGTLTGINGGEIKITVGAGGIGGNHAGRDGGESKVAIGFKSVSAQGGEGGGSSVQGGTIYANFDNAFGYHHPVPEERIGAGGRGGNGGFFGSYQDGGDGESGYAWFRIRKVMPND